MTADIIDDSIEVVDKASEGEEIELSRKRIIPRPKRRVRRNVSDPTMNYSLEQWKELALYLLSHKDSTGPTDEIDDMLLDLGVSSQGLNAVEVTELLEVIREDRAQQYQTRQLMQVLALQEAKSAERTRDLIMMSMIMARR